MLKKILNLLGLNFQSESIRFHSEYNEVLEVQKVNGKFILDSAEANYSYGALQKAFEFAFQQLELKNFFPKKILMLGLGAGCVLEILENYFHEQTYEVTAIEIDPLVVEISQKYFNIQRFKNLKILITDAQIFIQENHEIYDFIIVDLFVDLQIPEFLFETQIMGKLQKMTSKNGMILINTIPSIQDNNPILNELSKNGKLEILERYKNLNEMICWQNIK